MLPQDFYFLAQCFLRAPGANSSTSTDASEAGPSHGGRRGGGDAPWYSLQLQQLHPHYTRSILDDTVNRPSSSMQQTINRAIAGMGNVCMLSTNRFSTNYRFSTTFHTDSQQGDRRYGPRLYFDLVAFFSQTINKAITVWAESVFWVSDIFLTINKAIAVGQSL
jgi:hypothetical protein